MGSSEGEALCLKWNDYTSHLSMGFQDMRKNEDFFDITLITEDGEIRCHKLVLGACSPHFRNIIKRLSSILNPAIYLRGIRHEDIKNIIEFIYLGQVNVAHDELDSFLAAAEDLCIKGLIQPENTSFCAANTDSSYQPPAKKPRANKKNRNSNPKRVPKNEPQDIMDNEFHEELNIENDGESYFAETPFLKSFEPIFTLKDQHGEKLRFICNRCPNMDDSGKFIQKEICASVSSKWALKRHLRSCHTPKDLEEFEIISGKGSGNGNLRATPDPNPDLELTRNSTPNISSMQRLKHESPDDSMDHHSDNNRDEIQIENNVELLGDDHFNDSESNVQTFENFYEEPSAPYTKSYEPIYTLLDQIGEKLKFKCNKCPDEKIISSQVKSSWGLKRHMQSSHTIQDLEEFDSLHKRLGKKSL